MFKNQTAAKMSFSVPHFFIYTASISLLCVLIGKPNLSEALISYEASINGDHFNFEFNDVKDTPSRHRKHRRQVITSTNNDTTLHPKSNVSLVIDSVVTLVHLNDTHEQLTGLKLQLTFSL